MEIAAIIVLIAIFALIKLLIKVENKKYRYQKQNILNKSEKRVYELLKNNLDEQYKILPQVALGEALRCKSRKGFWKINAKRADLIVADEEFKPIAAIEYQGRGHNRGNYRERDKVKKEAIESANIKMFYIREDKDAINTAKELNKIKNR